jgi:hypothetical protein
MGLQISFITSTKDVAQSKALLQSLWLLFK